MVKLLEWAYFTVLMLLLTVSALTVLGLIVRLVRFIKDAKKRGDEVFLKRFVKETFVEYKNNPNLIKHHLQRKAFIGQPYNLADFFLKRIDDSIDYAKASLKPSRSHGSRPASDDPPVDS